MGSSEIGNFNPSQQHSSRRSVITDMDNSRQKEIYRVTLIGSAVNVVLLAFKFFAGIVGHSSAMIADAVHSLSDFISDIVVLVFVKISGRPGDADHAYGHGKYETLASVSVGLILGVVGIGIGYEAVLKAIDFFKGVPIESPNWWALSAAILSIVLKEALFRYTIIHGRKLDSPALTANAWHHRSDSLTSIATLIGIAGAMLLGDKGRVLDPLAALIVSLFIIKEAISLIRPGIDELMEKSISEDQQRIIANIITSQPGVTGFHRLKTRRIGTGIAIEVHIKMPGDLTLYHAHEIATRIEERLKNEFGPTTHVGIHMEPFKKKS